MVRGINAQGDRRPTPIPFSKLQEGNHLLTGVDLSQRVVWVHQYNGPDDNLLKEKTLPRSKRSTGVWWVFFFHRDKIKKENSLPKWSIPEVFYKLRTWPKHYWSASR